MIENPPLTPPLKWHDQVCRLIPGHEGYAACVDGTILTCWRFRGGGFALEVSKIRALRVAGAKLSELSKLFGVTETMISLIARRKVWRHV